MILFLKIFALVVIVMAISVAIAAVWAEHRHRRRILAEIRARGPVRVVPISGGGDGQQMNPVEMFPCPHCGAIVGQLTEP